MSKTRIQGIYQVSDFLDKVQEVYQVGVSEGDFCGWENLKRFYNVKRGQWTVLTGIPNHGKSMFLDNVMVNLAENSKWKFLVCSPENQPIERHIISLMEIYVGKRFDNGNNYNRYACITPQEIAESMLFLDEHFVFIYPEETDFHIDYILNLADEKYKESAYDGFVIDPYN